MGTAVMPGTNQTFFSQAALGPRDGQGQEIGLSIQ